MKIQSEAEIEAQITQKRQEHEAEIARLEVEKQKARSQGDAQHERERKEAEAKCNELVSQVENNIIAGLADVLKFWQMIDGMGPALTEASSLAEKYGLGPLFEKRVDNIYLARLDRGMRDYCYRVRSIGDGNVIIKRALESLRSGKP